MQPHLVRLTIDVDWAPDWAIDKLANDLIASGTPATWFVTHSSKSIDEIRKVPELFELGIHPNFMSGSTHGSTPKEVLEFCMDLVPEAITMRSHSLFLSSRILEAVQSYSNIALDVSTYLRDARNVQVISNYISVNRPIKQVAFCWEDNLEFMAPVPFWNGFEFLDSRAKPCEISILDVHPIHYALNSSNNETYENLKTHSSDLPLVPPVDFKKDLLAKPGTQTFVKGVMDYQKLNPESFRTSLAMLN